MIGVLAFSLTFGFAFYQWVHTVDTQQVLIEQGRQSYELIQFYKKYGAFEAGMGSSLIVGFIGLGLAYGVRYWNNRLKRLTEKQN